MTPAAALQPFLTVALPIILGIWLASWSQNKRFDDINKRLDDIIARLNRIDDRLTGIEGRVTRLEERTNPIRSTR